MVGSVLAISVVNISNNDWMLITNGWISSGNQCSRGVGYYTQLVWQVNNRHWIQTTRQTIHWIQTRKQTTVMSAAGVKMIAQRRQDQDVFVWNDQKLKCTDIQYITLDTYNNTDDHFQNTTHVGCGWSQFQYRGFAVSIITIIINVINITIITIVIITVISSIIIKIIALVSET